MRRVLPAAARFLAVSGLAFAATTAWPALVLAAPAWLAFALAPLLGLDRLGPPAISGPTITFAGVPPLALEDPYVLAGVPLYLGLWALASRPPRAIPWGRLAAGLAALEVVAGLTLALVALSVERSWTTSNAREPLEVVALVLVVVIRAMPLFAWMLLDRDGLPLRPRA